LTVFAIDPSTHRIGWAILERDGGLRDAGAVEPSDIESTEWQWRVTSMLGKLPRPRDITVMVVERPPWMRRKHQDRIIAAAGRCYEWGRLALGPREIIAPLPVQWMPKHPDFARKRETKPMRADRIAA